MADYFFSGGHSRLFVFNKHPKKIFSILFHDWILIIVRERAKSLQSVNRFYVEKITIKIIVLHFDCGSNNYKTSSDP